MEDTSPAVIAVSRRKPFSVLVPYLATGLFLVLALVFLSRSLLLSRELDADRTTLRAWQWRLSDQLQHQALADLRFSLLEVRNPTYAQAKVVISWNPHLHEGMIVTDGLPAAPANQDYQLWVLDPHEEAPVSGGPIKLDPVAHHFSVPELHTDLPGFAISLEPAGGSPSPTGPILLAVAPPP